MYTPFLDGFGPTTVNCVDGLMLNELDRSVGISCLRKQVFPGIRVCDNTRASSSGKQSQLHKQQNELVTWS